jgi:outer membrane usher protein
VHAAVAALCALGIAGARASPAPPVRFDPRLVFGGGEGARYVSRFDQSNPVPPGIYLSEIYVNGTYLDTRDVRVAGAASDARGSVCLDREVLRRLDLSPRRLLASARVWLAGHTLPECLPPGRIAPGLRARFDLSRLRVDVAAPAVLLERRPRGWVSPRSWSDGIVAGRLNYQFNAVRSHSELAGADATQIFLGLAAGFNVGAWQLRHSGTLDGTTGQGLHYSSSRSAVRHDLARLGGYVQFGQGQSDGQLFDSVGFRGILLASDARMQPASRQGYAPAIHGFAAAPSTVRVSQNGVLLYQTSVPAGAFAIDDLYAPAAGGALQVTVRALDGRSSRFTVPMSDLPQLQRSGHASYQWLAGRLRGADSGAGAGMPAMLGSVLYGIDDTLTGEAGLVAARGYAAGVLGAAGNTRVGAFELDLSDARFAHPWLGERRGRRLHAMWNLVVGASALDLSVSRASGGYYGLQDALAVPASPEDAAVTVSGAQRVRDEVQLGFTQDLGADGSMYFSGSSARYQGLGDPADAAQRQSSFQWGYVRSLGPMQWTVSLSRQLGNGGLGADTALQVSVSLPLGTQPGAATASFGLQRDGSGAGAAQWALAGTRGSDGRFSYGAQGSAGAGSRNMAVDAGWRGPGGSVGASVTQGWGQGGTTGSLSLSADGGVVAFGGGLTFTPFLGDTIALIDAVGAQGAAVDGGGGSRIDSRGYGVATYLTPYAVDTVGIEPTGGALLRHSSARVIPRAGAVVEVRLRARRGRWVLMSARQADGSALPFAAQVFDARRRLVGYVGQASRIDAHLERDSGRLLVRWGDAARQACRIDYRLPRATRGVMPVWMRGAVCRPAVPASAP